MFKMFISSRVPVGGGKLQTIKQKEARTTRIALRLLAVVLSLYAAYIITVCIIWS